jgi:hypothetical protein
MVSESRSKLRPVACVLFKQCVEFSNPQLNMYINLKVLRSSLFKLCNESIDQAGFATATFTGDHQRHDTCRRNIRQ